jgi:hypothetical protein
MGKPAMLLYLTFCFPMILSSCYMEDLEKSVNENLAKETLLPNSAINATM